MLRLLLLSTILLVTACLCGLPTTLTATNTPSLPTDTATPNRPEKVSTPDIQKEAIATKTSPKTPGGGNAPPVAKQTTQPASSSQREFHNEQISFHYPDNWRTMKEMFGFDQNSKTDRDFDGLLIFQVVNARPSGYGEKYTAWCKVVQKKITAGKSLEEMVNGAYDILKNYQDSEISQGPVTVNERTGIEKIYRRPHGEPWYQVRDTWLEKNEQVYILSCWAIPSIYEDSLEEFNLILHTLQIK